MMTYFHRDRLNELQQWWEQGVPFVEKTDEAWCDVVCEQDDVICWCSLEEGCITAYSQTDVEGVTGTISVVCHPERLRSGIATRHLRDVESRLEVLGVEKLVANIDVENMPSVAFFQKNGYDCIGRDPSEPTFLLFEKALPSSGLPAG